MKINKINPISLTVLSPVTEQVLFSGTVIKTRDGQSMGTDIPDQYFVLKVNSAAYASEYDEVQSGQHIITVPMMQIVEEKPLNFIKKHEALRLYKNIMESQNQYPYGIVGHSYTKDENGYQETGRERFICPLDIQSISDARAWMLQNHPDFYLGSVIYKDGPNKDFFIVADPNHYALVTSLESVDEMLLFEQEELGLTSPVKENFDVYEDIRNLSDDVEEYEF